MRNLQEREMDLEDLGTIRRIKLEQCVQLCQFENDANQVNRWIHSAEGKFSDAQWARIFKKVQAKNS